MSCTGWVIEVANWTQYNPRTETKRPSWFRFENDVATGPGFHGLNCEIKWTWIIVLSLVSQKNGEPITWNAKYVESVSGISEKTQIQAIGIFEKFGRLHVTRTEACESRTEACESRALRTNERDERTRRTNPYFDFSLFWNTYPRKVGKSDAKQRFKTLIQTEDEFRGVLLALSHFRSHHESRGTDEKYIPHPTTFLGTKEIPRWRDWLDPENGTSDIKALNGFVPLKIEDTTA